MKRQLVLKDGDQYTIQEDDWHVVRHALRTDADGDGGVEPLVVPLGKVLIPCKDFLDGQGQYGASRASSELGVWLAPEDDVAMVKPILSLVSVVAINFPSFRDGRGFSQAYLLRTRLGWKGQIRAIGNVLRDQLLYMQRVGFDAFSLDLHQNAAAAISAFNELKVRYQGDFWEQNPLYRREKRPTAIELDINQSQGEK